VLSTEAELVEEDTDFRDIVKTFATQKSRRKPFGGLLIDLLRLF